VDILRRLYANYRYMIAPTDFLYDSYAKNRFYPNKLKKIAFGINREMAKPFQTKKTIIDGKIRFGYIGQISRHKGIDLLIRAFGKLKGNNASLVIYGPADQNPDYMKELLNLARGVNPIEFRNTFPSEELPRRLSELDCLIIPSRWHENSPMVLLYALATKTPVIVSDAKGMHEFVANDINGYIFSMGDIEHLKSIMQRILDAPDSIARLSENASYSKDVSDHVRDVLDLYNAALAAQ
jgi:glycosyltransferase involved in cell wall biosynthesis